MSAETVPKAELQAARKLIGGQFVQSLTTQDGLATRLLNIILYGLPQDYLARFRSLVDAVTAADVRRVSERYVRPDQGAIVVVGDAGRLRDALKPIGPITEPR